MSDLKDKLILMGTTNNIEIEGDDIIEIYSGCLRIFYKRTYRRMTKNIQIWEN